MLRRFSVNFAILAMAVDGILVAAALYLTAYARPLLSSLPGVATMEQPAPVPPALFAVFPIAWVVIFASFSIYDGKRLIRVVDEFTVVSLSALLAAVALAGILYLSYRDFSRAQFLSFVLLCYVAHLLWRVFARLLFRLRRQHLPAAGRRVVIVGTGPVGRMLETRLRASEDYDLALVGFVDDEAAQGFSDQLLGSIAGLREVVRGREISDVIIALPAHFYNQMRQAVACLADEPVRVWVALGFFDLALYRTATEDFAGVPLVDLRASALDDYERLVKRAFDLAFGSISLLLSIPALAVSAMLILLDDGVPIIFRQKRVGENGRIFELLKLRTMVRNAEELRHLVEARDADGNLIHKTRQDPRITRVGRVLRRLSLDELPQLVNVLRGEMSVVGPRPEMPHLVEQYEPWQRQRLAVPPGITGWWQVTGRSDKVMHLHTEDDLYYVRNYSIWLDLLIIVRTIWVVILGRGAY